MDKSPIDMRNTFELIFGLIKLANTVSKNYDKDDFILLEIGSYSGQSMEIFANTEKFKRIICVDLWKPNYDINDKASFTDMVAVEKLFDSRLERMSDIEIIKFKGDVDAFAKSSLFLNELQGKIDVCYIDACHKYESVKHDIEVCLNSVKPNFAISGHDYAQYALGVIKAVDEFFEKPDVVFEDKSWLKCLK
jgi:hypothetical protein